MWNREHHHWFSPALGRSMELLIFGHGGAPVLVFPTSKGRFYEWEGHGMVDALSEHLARGWNQLVCVDSVDAESWYDHSKHPVERARRHEAYERYLLDEVLPLVRSRNPPPYLITCGASFGAYHAVNMAFRHPHVVDRVIGLSGLYDIREMTGEYRDDAVYFHDPSHYMMHERNPARLTRLRSLDIILAIGRDDPSRPNNEHLSGVLWEKDVWHALRLWDGWCHDLPWWRRMIVRYIGGAD